MISSVFTANGTKTVETCPVCGDPDMLIHHGCKSVLRGDEYYDTRYQHHEICPTCGESFPMVLYDCEECRGEQ
jgi:predicted RNA-binding Zn-ribbon protein involved in translation (DUF1610 family)